MTTVLSLQRRRASFSVDSKLPVTMENTVSASVSSSSSSNTKLSKIDEEDLFKKQKWRLSDKLQNRNLFPPQSSKRLLERRQSDTAIRRDSIVDLSTSEKVMEDIKRRKRSFFLNNCKRKSLGNIGANVISLIKAKNSFARLMNRHAETEEVEEEIKDDELPEKPRFASELSAEAQFAIMKGYEDVVHTMLHDIYPYKHSALRRTSTPTGDVRMKELARITPLLSGDKRLTLEIRQDKHEPGKCSVENATFCNDTLYVSPQGKASEISTKEIMPPVNHRSVQTALEKQTNTSLCDSVSVERRGTRTQLTMTYRYHRAMDILDTLRKQQGLIALSPRVKFANLLDPLNAYNSWSHGWIREFEIKKQVV